MKYTQHLTALSIALVAVAALAMGAGFLDPGTVATGFLVAEGALVADLKKLEEAVSKALNAMQDNIKKVQDTASNALEEVRREGSIFGKTNEQLKALGETGNQLAENVKELKDRVRDLEQKAASRPAAGTGAGKSIGEIVVASAEYAAARAAPRLARMDAVVVGSFHNVAITNTPERSQNQPLVPADRRPGIVMPAERRLTVRDLIPQNRTESNMVEFCREHTFTNNAGPQWDPSSPTARQEGAVKNESGITFELVAVPVTTLAHWIPASRQVLSDAPLLQGYVDGRLRYGLKLEEEDELLNGSGNGGELTGLVGQAAAFTGGATNQNALDTLLKAFLQVSLSEYEASGVVLNPIDWVNRIQLLKDNEGRYLFSNPHLVEQPRVWGKPVVPTQSIAAGNFLTGAFALGAELFDREDASVRISESHENFFVKNMVAILCEERLALVVYRPTAFVAGSLNFAG